MSNVFTGTILDSLGAIPRWIVSLALTSVALADERPKQKCHDFPSTGGNEQCPHTVILKGKRRRSE
jgi:hypothetical protein